MRAEKCADALERRPDHRRDDARRAKGTLPKMLGVVAFSFLLSSPARHAPQRLRPQPANPKSEH